MLPVTVWPGSELIRLLKERSTCLPLVIMLHCTNVKLNNCPKANYRDRLQLLLRLKLIKWTWLRKMCTVVTISMAMVVAKTVMTMMRTMTYNYKGCNTKSLQDLL